MSHRGNEIADGQGICPVPVGEEPRVGRRRPDRAPVSRDVSCRQAPAAVAVAFLECGRELDFGERFAPETLDERRLEARVGQYTARLVLHLLERTEPVR